MTDLGSIPGIGKATLELLEAAGFADAESLSKAGVDELASELERANRILQISKRAPVRGNIQKWIDAARDITGVAADAKVAVTMPVNYELSPDVVGMLASAPFAIPLPARLLMEQQLAVGDIPPAILLNRYSGDLEVRVEDRAAPVRSSGPRVAGSSGNGNGNGNVRMAESMGMRVEKIDSSKLRSTEEVAGGTSRPVSVKAENENERVALIRGPREETNKGRDPQSRFYIRGVLHSHPVSLATGAFFTLALVMLLPLGVVATTLLLLSDIKPEHFGWVPKWLLVFPFSVPLFGFGYLIWGLPGNCRICSQKLFVPKMCLKNSKAHRLPLIGHIIPLCLHILLFRWFRCTYCGTPVRLKK